MTPLVPIDTFNHLSQPISFSFTNSIPENRNQFIMYISPASPGVIISGEFSDAPAGEAGGARHEVGRQLAQRRADTPHHGLDADLRHYVPYRHRVVRVDLGWTYYAAIENNS